MDDNLNKLKKIISDKFGVPQNEITRQSDLEGDFNLSSIEINDLLAIIRKEFDLEIPADSETEKVSAVDDLMNMIENYSEL